MNLTQLSVSLIAVVCVVLFIIGLADVVSYIMNLLAPLSKSDKLIIFFGVAFAVAGWIAFGAKPGIGRWVK